MGFESTVSLTVKWGDNHLDPAGLSEDFMGDCGRCLVPGIHWGLVYPSCCYSSDHD